MKNIPNNIKPKIIDCTLRDGGYYNNWDFNIEIIQKYIYAVQKAGVDFIELGFRTKNKLGYFGPLAYTTEDFIEELKINLPVKLGVMINCSDLMKSKDLEKDMHSLFPIEAKNSKLSIVRIACKYDEISKAFNIAKWLKRAGYVVCINLMQISSVKNKDIIEFGKYGKIESPDVLFIGDSTGTLLTENIKEIYNAIRTHWKGDIGIHAHDNMHRALSNTLEAYKNGFNWLDSTVQGMGRGPGGGGFGAARGGGRMRRGYG